LNVKHVLFLLH